MAALLLPTSAWAQSDVERERERVEDRQAEIADDLDVLEATSTELGAALDDVASEVASQEVRVEEANEAVDAAADELAAAEADLADARADVAVLKEAIAEMAIASFVHQPALDLVDAFVADSLSDALLRRQYLDARAKRDVALLDLLEQAEVQAERRAAEVAAAAEEAEAAAADAAAVLAGLQARRADQRSLATQVEARIDASLAEVSVLAERDAELAAEIAAEQAALIERLPEPEPEPVPTAAPASDSSADESGEDANDPDDSDDSDDSDDPSPPPPPPPPPPSNCPSPSVRTVQGITVATSIAGNVDALLTQARADGVPLGGWGYRSCERQVELRRAHCGPTNYDIYQKPPGQCSPPTARPGESMHERGLAIDFTYQGATIRSRSSPAFQWLATNAAGYGLYNLPSEPWHWSTNGW